jgi:hypothetical protein
VPKGAGKYWALQAAEKLIPVGIRAAALKGHDFNRAVNALEPTLALAPEECFLASAERESPFSAACSAPAASSFPNLDFCSHADNEKKRVRKPRYMRNRGSPAHELCSLGWKPVKQGLAEKPEQWTQSNGHRPAFGTML